MNRKKASRLYLWLWLSPLLTIPTLAFLIMLEPMTYITCTIQCGSKWYGCCNYYIAENMDVIIAILLSGLWHLILLSPARNKDNFLVRWHGRQALALGGLRTAVPLFFGYVYGYDVGFLFFVPVVALIWLIGNIWGQRQAKRGDCSLARWLGHSDKLLEISRQTDQELTVEQLIKIIRFSKNPDQRSKALSQLKELGYVEEL